MKPVKNDYPTKISVIIPCYKQAHYLSQAVESILAQTYPSIEIIVVDDGSPDNTAEVAARYGERIKYFRKANAGLPAARNSGILLASGEFCIFLDADDYLPPMLIEQHMMAASKSPQADVFYATYHFVDEEGRSFGSKFNSFVSEDALHDFLIGNHFPPHAAMTRRIALANSGLFDVHLRSVEDWDMWIRLAAAGSRFVRTPDADVPYRQYPTSMSRNYERMRASALSVLRKSAGYRPTDVRYKKAIASGRWGVRTAFLLHTKSELDAAGWTASSIKSGLLHLVRACWQDPLLAFTGLRNTLRRWRWKLAGKTFPKETM